MTPYQADRLANLLADFAERAVQPGAPKEELAALPGVALALAVFAVASGLNKHNR